MYTHIRIYASFYNRGGSETHLGSLLLRPFEADKTMYLRYIFTSSSQSLSISCTVTCDIIDSSLSLSFEVEPVTMTTGRSI